MSSNPVSDTQPRNPLQQTQPRPPQKPTPQPDTRGPGCLAWGLLSVAALAFSLLVLFVSGVGGYISGQTAVANIAATAQRDYVNEQLATWIPQDLANRNTVLLGARIEGLASLTPPPPELPALIITATQFAIDNQPTATPLPTQTPLPTATLAATSTPTLAPTIAPTIADDAPLFDPVPLFTEAQAQMAAGQYDEAVRSLDAVMAIDENFRTAEVQTMLFTALNTQATRLLRSGNPSDLSAGIVKANEAAQYGDIGDLAYETYIAGIYLNGVSKETTNLQGAINDYSQIYAQAPNYLDVRQKLFSLRVELGDLYFETLEVCPAAAQYEAALTIQYAMDVETKLQTAQTSCGGSGSTGTGSGVTIPESTPEGGPAPLGQRDDG